MSENPGGQPLGELGRFPALKASGSYRQIIKIIEQLLDSNPPGIFVRESLSELMEEVNAAVIGIRPVHQDEEEKSDKEKSRQVQVLEKLRQARTAFQLAIDNFERKEKLYKYIENARKSLEEALHAW